MDITPYFKNCLSVREETGFFRPLRFNERQLAVYRSSESLQIRSLAPSGVCLDFSTDATFLSLDYRITGRARNWACFDVMVNGALYDTTVLTDLEMSSVRLALGAPVQKRVTVYLPHLVCIAIGNISMDSDFLPSPGHDRLLLCLGDSITQGMCARRPSSTYPALLAKHLNCDFLNHGVGGAVFDADTLARLEREPDLITIAFGTNDWNHRSSPEELRQYVHVYLNRLAETFICRNVYGILPIWRSDCGCIYNNMCYEEVRDIIRGEYLKFPYIHIVDGFDLVASIPGFYGDPGDLKVHPNDEGFLHYALNLARMIK